MEILQIFSSQIALKYSYNGLKVPEIRLESAWNSKFSWGRTSVARPSRHWLQSLVIYYLYIYICKCSKQLCPHTFKFLLGIKTKLDLHQNWTVENMCYFILWMQYKIQEFFSEWYTSRVNMRFLLESVLVFGVFDETCAICSS